METNEQLTDPTKNAANNTADEITKDDKRTIAGEADLSLHEIEQMEKDHADKAYKGSSGPEEKDIAV